MLPLPTLSRGVLVCAIVAISGSANATNAPAAARPSEAAVTFMAGRVPEPPAGAPEGVAGRDPVGPPAPLAALTSSAGSSLREGLESSSGPDARVLIAGVLLVAAALLLRRREVEV